MTTVNELIEDYGDASQIYLDEYHVTKLLERFPLPDSFKKVMDLADNLKSNLRIISKEFGNEYVMFYMWLLCGRANFVDGKSRRYRDDTTKHINSLHKKISGLESEKKDLEERLIVLDSKYSLAKFEEALKHMDWYYQYSDDRSVYRAGEERYQELLEWSKKDEDHAKLFRQYGSS